jgi:hypothetical protein
MEWHRVANPFQAQDEKAKAHQFCLSGLHVNNLADPNAFSEFHEQQRNQHYIWYNCSQHQKCPKQIKYRILTSVIEKSANHHSNGPPFRKRKLLNL